ncbi:MAG: hypothetical protein JWM99_4818 [Verrucomicrobiales bacterium]|jgi:DNA invertase Pin-like site-specific DNA recombinase|nr:hypothetical protein [Verrucomicrobiales bacterium]
MGKEMSAYPPGTQNITSSETSPGSTFRNEIIKFPITIPVPPASRRILDLLRRYPDKTYAEIATICGCTRQHVYRCLQQHGERIDRFLETGGKETRGRKPADPYFIQQVVDMYKNFSAQTVALHFGISKTTVKIYAEKRGLRKRTRKTVAEQSRKSKNGHP